MTMPINTLQSLTLLSCVVSHVMTQVIDYGDVYVKTLANSTNVGEYLSLGGPINSWMPIAKTECVLACVGLGRECGAVEFDELSGKCTIGATVVRNNGIPLTQQQNTTMFFSSSRIPGTCNETLGFPYKVKLNTHVCIHFSSVSKTRSDSKIICEEKGGTLYLPNSVEKIDILREYVPNYDGAIFIGLKKKSYRFTEYYWPGLVEFMTSDPFWEIFWNGTGQPESDTASCVEAKHGATVFAPIHCGQTRRYACEMPPY